MFIVAVSSHAPTARPYVIVCRPIPAIAGLNVPVDEFVIPVPDHVPPRSTEFKITYASSSQNGPAGVIDASTSGSTSRRLTADEVQFMLEIVYVIM